MKHPNSATDSELNELLKRANRSDSLTVDAVTIKRVLKRLRSSENVLRRHYGANGRTGGGRPNINRTQ